MRILFPSLGFLVSLLLIGFKGPGTKTDTLKYSHKTPSYDGTGKVYFGR